MKNLTLLSIFLCYLYSQGEAQSLLNPNSLNGEKVKAAMLYWDYGAPEYLTIESIFPTQDSIHQYWNVTHRSPFVDEKSGNGFDFYKINRQTLKPVLSHMYHQGFTNYKIDFQEDRAKIEIQNPSDSIEYTIPIPDYIAPEGPGLPVFLASLPLEENYHIVYQELNRWSGKKPNTAELIQTELKVVGSDELEIDGKSYPTYIINITNNKNRLTEIWALQEAPHYWVKVNHRIDENRTMRSKVVKILILDS